MDRLTTGGAPAWYGGIFVAFGGFIMLIAAGVIPTAPDTMLAPPWVVAMAGVVLAVGGAKSMTAHGSGLSQIFAMLMAASLGAVSVWAAVAGNDPVVNVGGSVGPVGVSVPASPGLGRFMFGLGGLLLWMAVLILGYRYVTSSRRGALATDQHEGME